MRTFQKSFDLGPRASCGVRMIGCTAKPEPARDHPYPDHGPGRFETRRDRSDCPRF